MIGAMDDVECRALFRVLADPAMPSDRAIVIGKGAEIRLDADGRVVEVRGISVLHLSERTAKP